MNFEKVENWIMKKEVENWLDFIKGLRFRKFLFCLIWFVGGWYAMNLFIWLISTSFGGETPTVPLDANNEYKNILNNTWFMHGVAIYVAICIIRMFLLRDKNNMKAFKIYYIDLSVFWGIFLIYTFKGFQLLVYARWLRIFYTILFICTVCFVIYKIIRNYLEIKEGRKKNSKLEIWFSRHNKTIISISGGVGGIYFLIKTIFSGIGNFERNLIGSLIDFLPLFVCIGILTLIWGGSKGMKAYYVNKYSEEFRQKFEMSKEEWHGEKYKG